MRIALIDPSLFTFPYDQAFAKGLIECGHEPVLYARRPGPEDGPQEDVPLDPVFYPVASHRAVGSLPSKFRLAIKGVDHIGSMMRLLARLRRLQPDVIHFQWLPLPGFDRMVLRQFGRIAPTVMTVHDTEPFNGSPASRLQVGGFLQCLKTFDRLIVHTAQGERRLRDLGLDPERIVRHAMGPHYEIVAGDPDPMCGKLTFMLFGKIKAYKGADLLIEAFAMMPEALRAQVRVRIVGKPYIDLAPLQRMVDANGLDVTIEPGFVDDGAITTLFGPGTIAIFPYREIEASAVLLQAMACGRPVIASSLGGFAELLTDTVHGSLVPPGDVAALSAAMSHMVADRAFAAACAASVRTLAAETPTWKDIARETVQTYRAAAAARVTGDRLTASVAATPG